LRFKIAAMTSAQIMPANTRPTKAVAAITGGRKKRRVTSSALSMAVPVMPAASHCRRT
jgi:hypothetical protein